MEFKGRFVECYPKEIPCKDEDCKRQSDIYLPCLACYAHFHDLEALQVHYESESNDDHRIFNPFREYTLTDLNKALDCTIKKDSVSKDIIFLNMLNAQTDEDQFNTMLAAESSTGKSYIVLEISSYFPSSEVIKLAGASPTSIVHENGKEVIEDENGYTPWDEYVSSINEEITDLEFLPKKTAENTKLLMELKKKLVKLRKKVKTIVDYEGKILIFLDQPNAQLLTKIRPFLSHDEKQLEFHIVDKGQGKGAGIRTKNIILIGYASVFFCTANLQFDEQEATRTFVLSPESNPLKIEESLELLGKKLANRDKFRNWLNSQPERKALMYRIELIRTLGVRTCTIEDTIVLNRFRSIHGTVLLNRHQRDFPRIHSLVYGHCLLNSFSRSRLESPSIVPHGSGDIISLVATEADVKAAFELYSEIMEANESGLPPELYNLYKDFLLPFYNTQASDPEYPGMSTKEIISAYQTKYQCNLAYRRLTEQIIPALVASSKLEEVKNPADKRYSLYIPTSFKNHLTKPTLDTVPTTNEPEPMPVPDASGLEVYQR